MLWRRVGDEVLVHDRESRRVCFLNATATRVWEMTSQGQDTGEIAAAICAASVVPDRGQVYQDVERCRDELHRLGLLDCSPQVTREDSVDEIH
jgi:hypothetical protein